MVSVIVLIITLIICLIIYLIHQTNELEYSKTKIAVLEKNKDQSLEDKYNKIELLCLSCDNVKIRKYKNRRDLDEDCTYYKCNLSEDRYDNIHSNYKIIECNDYIQKKECD